MRALVYLYFTRLKNSLRELVRSPGKLILYLVILASLIFTNLSASMDGVNENLRDIQELYVIVFAFLAIIFILGVLPGLNSGATFYTMADVNLLFSTPISSKRILIYGLVRQLGTTLFMGIFMLYQYSWMHSNYGVDFLSLIIMILGYALTVFSAQLAAMLIYSISSSSDKRKGQIKAVIYGICLIFILWLALPLLGMDTANFIEIIVERAVQPVFMLFPVAGWICAAIRGFLTGDTVLMLLGLGAVALFISAFTIAVLKLNADYYEDVLVATEVSHSAVTAQKEGVVQEASRRNIKLGKEGISKGHGASAFFYKHLLESRRAGLFIFDAMTLSFIVICIVMAIFFGEGSYYICLFLSSYFLLFTIGSSRWSRELQKPYIYMAPQSSFKKLVMACGESFLKLALESIAIITVMGIITKGGVGDIIVGILMRVGIGLIFISVTVAIERIFGGKIVGFISIMLHVLALVLFVLPGTVLALVALFVLGVSQVFALVIFSACCYGISLLVIFLSRNMLTCAELNSR